MVDAPSIGSHLCQACREHFNSLKELLDEARVKYQINTKLVRGLDYYTRTTFEAVSDLLGAQNAIAGGGRYDCLVESFGGPSTPACGFALGIERLVMAISGFFSNQSLPVFIYIVALGERAKREGFTLLGRLRILSSKHESKFSIEMDYGERSFKSQMRLANKKGASFVLILGDDEIEQGQILLKNMLNGEQSTVLNNDVESTILKKVL